MYLFKISRILHAFNKTWGMAYLTHWKYMLTLPGQSMIAFTLTLLFFPRTAKCNENGFWRCSSANDYFLPVNTEIHPLIQITPDAAVKANL